MIGKNTKIPLRAGHVVTLRGDGGQLVVALVLSVFAKAKKPVHTFRAASMCSQASRDRSNSEISLRAPWSTDECKQLRQAPNCPNSQCASVNRKSLTKI